MKISKRPKPVEIATKDMPVLCTTYVCPSCKMQYWGPGSHVNVLRFACPCGQVLNVLNPKMQTKEKAKEER